MGIKTLFRLKLTQLSCIGLISLNFGCFKSSDRDKATLSSSPQMEATREKALASSYFEIANSRDASWWKMFDSKQLDDLMEEALRSSPTLQVAEAKIVTAQANAKSIRSKLFPELGLDAAENWSYLSKYGFFRDFFPLPPGFIIPSKFNELDLSLNFSYELDFWGKNRKKLKQALGLALSKQMEKEETALVLCEAVAFSYFEWQAHTAEKKIYEKWLSAEEKLQNFYSSRYEVGLDNTIPPLLQEQSLGKIKQQIIDIEKKQEIDLLFLNNLLGRGPEEPLALEFVPEHLQHKIRLPEHLGLDLITQRPDLMAQVWKVTAAADAIGVAKTEFYPDVNLRALAGISSLTFSHFFQWASRTGSLMPSIHLPVFTGGMLEANLDEKVALYNQEVYQYDQMLLKAAQEVATEITTFLSLTQELEIQRLLVSAQTKAYTASSLRFEIGVDDYKPSLTAAEQLFAQEINAVRFNHSQILSTLRIIQSLGGGMQTQKLPPSLYPQRN